MAVVLGITLTSPAWAEDKSRYTLFNPAPKELMREMSTDRPDKTESPYTVDAGHYQIEMSFADYEYDHEIGNDMTHRTQTWTLVPVNLKAGLLNNVDIQFVFEPYVIEETDGIDSSRKDGFGDIQTRLKINLWGNDGGDTAMALMPYVKFPASSDDLGNDDVEGGLIVPIAFALPNEWNMGLMAEIDVNQDVSDSGYHIELIHTITFSHTIVGDLSGYVEFFHKDSLEAKTEWIGTVDAGVTYAVSDDIQLDAGINTGITNSASDVNVFGGITLRY